MFSRLEIPAENEPYNTDNYSRRRDAYYAFIQGRVTSPANDFLFDRNEYLTSTNQFLGAIPKTQRQYLVSHFKQHNKKLYYLSMVSDCLLYARLFIPYLFGVYLGCGTSLPLWLKIVYVLISFIVLWFGSLQIVRKIENRIFWTDERYNESREFYMRLQYLEMFFVEQGYVKQWATARYAKYGAHFNAVFGSRGRKISSWDGKSYKWMNVGKGKFIIIDKATGKEPELLPGVKPYFV